MSIEPLLAEASSNFAYTNSYLETASDLFYMVSIYMVTSAPVPMTERLFFAGIS